MGHRHTRYIVTIDNTKTSWVPEDCICVVAQSSKGISHCHGTYTRSQFQKCVTGRTRLPYLTIGEKCECNEK